MKVIDSFTGEINEFPFPQGTKSTAYEVLLAVFHELPLTEAKEHAQPYRIVYDNSNSDSRSLAFRNFSARMEIYVTIE